MATTTTTATINNTHERIAWPYLKPSYAWVAPRSSGTESGATNNGTRAAPALELLTMAAVSVPSRARPDCGDGQCQYQPAGPEDVDVVEAHGDDPDDDLERQQKHRRRRRPADESGRRVESEER